MGHLILIYTILQFQLFSFLKSVGMHFLSVWASLLLALKHEVTGARGYKTFFMLNSAEHEILNAHKYNNIKKLSIFRLR